jgi:hypothetical protein
MGLTSRPRRFTLLDAIILVAATAIGFALWRPALELMWIDMHNYYWPRNGRWFWYNAVRSVNLLAPWSLALLALSLRQPRAHRLASRPSVVVGIVVSAGLVMWAMLLLFAVSVKGGSPVHSVGGVHFRICLLLPSEVALSLTSIWLLQALGPGDGRRLDWLDTIGWVLGGCWIVLGLLSLALYLLADS